MIGSKLFLAAIACSFVSLVPQAVAQNSIQLFGPVNVRPSASTTSYANPVNFNSNTLNLSCPATPSAVLSSTTDSSGFVLVDNNINVTVAGTTTNACTGAGGDPDAGPVPSCFTSAYAGPAVENELNGTDPDTLLPAGGVAPIDISSLLTSGSQQVKFDLEDEGGWLASSTLYLNTNCTSGGVSGPATISGSTIPQSNPTTQQLNQNFTFNPLANNGINFGYDLSTAQTAGTLAIDPNGANPSVSDSSLDPTTWQTVWATGTSFATSNCLIHNGEILPSGQAGCKLYTLDCTIGTGGSASGVNCPISTAANEVFSDTFDGPTFTLPDIRTTGGDDDDDDVVKFHQGIGFLMASEPWTGGPCTFAQGSGFENSTCPMNVLATFSGPGTFNSSGISTHPNSTFITTEGVVEDLTSIRVTGMTKSGYWVRTSTPTVTFSSQPPPKGLPGSNLPGAANFVPSPITSITYGISAANNVPSPGAPIPTDITLSNGISCPLPTNPGTPPATTFTPPQQQLGPLADGQYALHYFATDCAGTMELKFVNNGSWTTNFYTFPINVDTTLPVVATGPTLSPAPPYHQGQPGVTATFSCTDNLSGVALCGGKSFAPGTLNTGPVTVPVSTAKAGTFTFNVVAVDAAGNQSPTASKGYTVNAKK